METGLTYTNKPTYDFKSKKYCLFIVEIAQPV